MTAVRRALLLLAWLAVGWCASAQDKPLAITNVNIVDVTDGSIARNATIYIRNGRILWIAHTALLEHGIGLQVVNGTERYVIPGLWNMHTHLTLDVPSEYTERVLLPLMIANGVTVVRDMGGSLPRLKSLRDRISSGKLLGPRIMFSGPMLDGPQPDGSDTIAVATPNDARAAVQMLKQQDVDFIKVLSQVPRVAYFAVADEARKQGLMFVGHVPDAVTVSEASDAGQRTMEHMFGILRDCSTEEPQIMAAAEEFARRKNVTPAEAGTFAQAERQRILRTFNAGRADKLFERLVSNRNWQTPTLVFQRFYEYADRAEWDRDPNMRFVPPPMRAKWKQEKDTFLKSRSPANLESWQAFFRKNRQLIAQMRRDHVHFLAGTDDGPYAFPGSALLDELELLVQNGLTPYEALKSATIEAAIVMRRQHDYGAVAQGRMADLVFLDGNPLENIANVRKISAVVVNGRFLDRPDLDRMIESAAKAAGAIK